MNQQISLTRISALLSRFITQVKILSANAQYDANIVAEDILVHLLNKAYGYNLMNANFYKKNYPGVDLIDPEGRVAFQVTSTATMSKVKHTIEQIIDKEQYNDFDQFFIYIITEKNKRYNNEKIVELTQGKFTFTAEHIVDYSDLFKHIATLEYDHIEEIRIMLEKQFADKASSKSTEAVTEELPKVIENMKTDAQMRIKALEIEGLQKARELWVKKRAFFLERQPLITDFNQEFAVSQQMEMMNAKIAEMDEKIAALL